ncbi:MAG: GEVED domain-containing protein [Bacteroidota bacterium]
MNLSSTLLPVIIYSLFSFPLYSQINEAHVPGQLIVMLEPGFEHADPKLPPIVIEGKSVIFEEKQTLSNRIRIFLFEFDATHISEGVVLESVRALPQVQLAQYNHYVAQRGIQTTFPNDSLFNNQWDMHNTGQTNGTIDADIDAPEAWDISKGGITALGDTIVVAVIDGGCDLSHQDLNLWKNHGEIPNNGLDDDNNGFIDDYDGWNAYSNTGNIPNDSHGTHVSGTVSAKGNNTLGVSGVNWHAQIMPIAGSSGNEAIVVTAYDYALSMRALYNQTNGKEGAFVVATNSSFGVDFGNPANFPIWCAMYDSMGMEGILSAAATMNNNSDVDQTGDVPTACASPWMIAVTNTTHHDNKNNGAAFGLTTIDIGAPGTNILSTTPNNNYSSFTGTSMASPHIAGAVAFLLSAPCPGFISQYKLDPANMALTVRDYLFQGVDSIQALSGITVTDGRLNLFNSIEMVQTDCSTFSECIAVSNINTSQLTDSSVWIDWLAVDSSVFSYSLSYKEADSSSWIVASTQDSMTQFSLIGLEACTSYDLRFRSFCAIDSSQWSNSFQFTTEGCCEAPEEFLTASVGDSMNALSWNAIYGATAYQIRYRLIEDSLWQHHIASDTNIVLSFLTPCANYELQVATICEQELHDFSSSIFLTTLGCEICAEADYCIDAPDTQFGYIDSVVLGPLVAASGDNNGFAEWVSSDLAFDPFATYPIRLVPGSNAAPPVILWRIWIDINQDSVFSDSTEVVYQSPPSQGVVNGTLALPSYVPLGRTRMRIGAKILTVDGAYPEACGGYELGEIEDYCIRFVAPCGPINQIELSRRQDSSGMVDVSWTSGHPDHQYLLEYRPIGGSWTQTMVDSHSVSLGPLTACEQYQFRVQPICEEDTGEMVSSTPIWTLGCGDCRDTEYCQTTGMDASASWIEQIDIGAFSNLSGNDQGYGDYLSQSIDLRIGDQIGFTLQAGLDSSQQAQFWRIWLDLNQDGDFEDSAELMYDGLLASIASQIDSFMIPATATPGISRMRVQIQPIPVNEACGTFALGEVEEYCANILPEGSSSVENSWVNSVRLYPNPAGDVLSVQADFPIYRIQIWDVTGQLIWHTNTPQNQTTQIPMDGLSAGMYQIVLYTSVGRIIRKVVKADN